MSAFSNLKELVEASRTCNSCALCKGRTQVVPGEGIETASILFIGEGPGFHEDKQGRPFVGPAGKLLDELIGSIGLQRPQVYITNVVKCRPPGNRDPLPEEIEACRPWLDQQIEFIRPKVIVTLGRHAMGHFLPGETVTRAHGQARRSGKHLVMPMYHPAAALYQQSLKKTLEEDFKKIPELLKAVPADAGEASKSAIPAPTAASQPQPSAAAKKKEEEKPQQMSLF